ncbi:MAG: type III pantothenate kinase [Acidobacteriota bacterium]
MLLVIDIGNTNLVLGVFEGAKLQHSWRVATRRSRTADEYAVLCHNLFELGEITASDFEAVVISSVVPPLNAYFESLSCKYFHQKPIFVEPESQSLIPILYHPISDVGADRIVNAVAAIEMAGCPAIVLDFGTATTFDAISPKGEYLGGIIAPGLGISAEALFLRASKLPRVGIRKPSRVIGDSTVGSIQSGLYFGYVALVEGILRRMRKEMGRAAVIATGGLAGMMSADLKSVDRVEEDLTLYGLQIFYRKTQSG